MRTAGAQRDSHSIDKHSAAAVQAKCTATRLSTNTIATACGVTKAKKCTFVEISIAMTHFQWTFRSIAGILWLMQLVAATVFASDDQHHSRVRIAGQSEVLELPVLSSASRWNVRKYIHSPSLIKTMLDAGMISEEQKKMGVYSDFLIQLRVENPNQWVGQTQTIINDKVAVSRFPIWAVMRGDSLAYWWDAHSRQGVATTNYVSVAESMFVPYPLLLFRLAIDSGYTTKSSDERNRVFLLNSYGLQPIKITLTGDIGSTPQVASIEWLSSRGDKVRKRYSYQYGDSKSEMPDKVIVTGLTPDGNISHEEHWVIEGYELMLQTEDVEELRPIIPVTTTFKLIVDGEEIAVSPEDIGLDEFMGRDSELHAPLFDQWKQERNE